MSDRPRIDECDALINDALLSIYAGDVSRIDYASQVCQRCGRLDSWLTIGLGPWGRWRPKPGSANFICSSCADFYGGLVRPEPAERFAEEQQRQAHRYCELCADPIEKRPVPQHHGRWLCGACYARVGGFNLIALVRSFIRQRFLRQQKPKDRDGAAWLVELAGHGSTLDVSAIGYYVRLALENGRNDQDRRP